MRPLPSFAIAITLAACGHSAPAPSASSPAAPETPAPPPAPPTTPPAAHGPPVARTVDVVDEQFGLKVPDPYRWMETEEEERTTWMRAQAEYTSAWLDRIPGRAALSKRVRALGLETGAPGGLQLAGGRLFYSYIAAGEQLPKLIVREPDGKERVLVDPATLGGEGGHASLNNFAPSPDGELLAYNIALGGGEISTIRVLEVDSGKPRPDAIEKIWGEFAAGWLPDSSGFFYTQMAEPEAGRDPLTDMQARFHRLGAPVTDDVAVLGRGVGSVPVAHEEFPLVYVTPGSRWAIAAVVGAHQEGRYAVAPLARLVKNPAKAPWRVVADLADHVEGIAIHGDRVYVVTSKDAPNRKILSMPASKPVLAKARVVLREDPEIVTEWFSDARDALYVNRTAGGVSRVLRVPWNGKPEEVAMPYDGSVRHLATDALADGVTFGITGWTRPYAYYAGEKKGSREIGLAATSPADFSGIIAEKVEVTSADGTKVPLSILRRSDLALDGSHPTILYGYGGYGYSQMPAFNAVRLAWLERGGVFAVAHVRGGGEKGARWHIDGIRDKKMNGIRDFIACGEYLVDQKYTSPERLAAQGGSMGGILVGRAITERPDLFVAANIAVGAVNPLRMLAAPNGANQKVELGDAETADGYRWIYEMDPYLHVTAGTSYPAVIFTVGLNDKRVAPWMSAKMAARMQAANPDGRPVLIRSDDDAGHGVGSTRDQSLAEAADVFAFFLAMAGDPELQPRGD